MANKIVQFEAPKVHLDWLDYTRFFAAFAVMLFHYCSSGIRNGKISSIDNFGLLGKISDYGYLGVDVFFMVSGFVIFYSLENKTADKFAMARAVRLYPAFLACMTTTAIVSALWGDGVTVSQYLVNLTMAASYLGYKNIDGVYWTLSLELAFYAATFVLIFFGQEKRLERFIYGWIVLIFIFKLLAIEVLLFSGYFSLFAAGSLFALIYRHGYSWARIVLLATIYATCIFVALDHAAEIDARDLSSSNKYVITGLTTAFFGIFAFFKNSNLKLPAAKIIGSLTYPLYLLHATIGLLILSNFGSNENKWLLLFATITLMIAASWFVNQYIEVRARQHWRRLADGIIGSPIRFGERLKGAIQKN